MLKRFSINDHRKSLLTEMNTDEIIVEFQEKKR
jgi:hypothetical protein